MSELKIPAWETLIGKQSQNGKSKKNFFVSRTAIECLRESKNKPVPKMIFDEFWSEGELCICFAEPGAGKSIKGVQIAQSAASGMPIHGFRIGIEAQPVAYFDYELSLKQFERRYSTHTEGADLYENHYNFSDNFSE